MDNAKKALKTMDYRFFSAFSLSKKKKYNKFKFC